MSKKRLIAVLILLGCAPKFTRPLAAPQTVLARWGERRGTLSQKLLGSGRVRYEGRLTWEGRFLLTATPATLRFQLLGPLGLPMGEIRIQDRKIHMWAGETQKELPAQNLGPLMLTLGLFFGNLAQEVHIVEGYETSRTFVLLLAGYGDTVEVQFRKKPLEPLSLRSLALNAGTVFLSDYRQAGPLYLPWTLFYKGPQETLEIRFDTLRRQSEEVQG